MIPVEDQTKLPEDENTPEKRADKIWSFFQKKENGNYNLYGQIKKYIVGLNDTKNNYYIMVNFIYLFFVTVGEALNTVNKFTTKCFTFKKISRRPFKRLERNIVLGNISKKRKYHVLTMSQWLCR